MAISGEAAANILLDCTCAIIFCATDTGGGETYAVGSIASFKADKVSWARTVEHADHRPAQSLVEINRLTGVGWEVTVEAKLSQANAALAAALITYPLAKLTVTTGVAAGIVAPGLIVNEAGEYTSPSTLKFGIKAHGTDLTVTG